MKILINRALLCVVVPLLIFACKKDLKNDGGNITNYINESPKLPEGTIVKNSPVDTVGFHTVKTKYSPGATFYLRVNRSGGVVEQFEVIYQGVYEDGFDRLIVCKAPVNLPVGSGDSGSPLLTSGDKVAGVLCYGFKGNSDVILARTIEDVLKVSDHTHQKNSSGYNTSSLMVPFTPIFFMSGMSADYAERISQEQDRPMNNLIAISKQGYPSKSTAGLAYTSNQGSTQGSIPGNSITVSILYGDVFEMYAIGTLSFMKDDKLWAFGHPFLNELLFKAAPVFQANMITMVTTPDGAFKFAQPLYNRIGTLVADQFDGILIDKNATSKEIEIITQININNKEISSFNHFFASLHDPLLEKDFISEINSYLTYLEVLKSTQELDLLKVTVRLEATGISVPIDNTETSYGHASVIDFVIYNELNSLLYDVEETLTIVKVSIDMEDCTEDCGYYYPW